MTSSFLSFFVGLYAYLPRNNVESTVFLNDSMTLSFNWKSYSAFNFWMKEYLVLLFLPSLAIFDLISPFKSSKDPSSFESKSLIMCQPNLVLTGSLMSPFSLSAKSASSKAGIKSPAPNHFNLPPIPAEFLSSENCFAICSNVDPVFSLL